MEVHRLHAEEERLRRLPVRQTETDGVRHAELGCAQAIAHARTCWRREGRRLVSEARRERAESGVAGAPTGAVTPPAPIAGVAGQLRAERARKQELDLLDDEPVRGSRIDAGGERVAIEASDAESAGSAGTQERAAAGRLAIREVSLDERPGCVLVAARDECPGGVRGERC